MSEPWVAALCGFGVAAVSACIAWLSLRWSATRPGLAVAAVLGGTLIRLVLVGAASVLLLLLTTIDSTTYITSLAAFYLAFLGAEIYLIARRSNKPVHPTDEAR